MTIYPGGDINLWLEANLSGGIDGKRLDGATGTLELSLRAATRELLSLQLSDLHECGACSDFTPLKSRLQERVVRLSLREVNHLLDKLESSARSDNDRDVLAAMHDLFTQLMDQFRGVPEHPRTFVLREIFSTEAEQTLGIICLDGKVGGSAAAESILNRLNYVAYRAPEAGEGSRAYQDVFATRDELRAVFAALVSADSSIFDQLEPEYKPVVKRMPLLRDLCDDTVRALGNFKSGLHECLPGTQLIAVEGRAIPKRLIEHALLTSNHIEVVETLRCGATMIAVGLGLINHDRQESLHLYDCGEIGISYQDMAKSGFRIVGLVAALTRGDSRFAEVMSAYGKERLELGNDSSTISELCRNVWRKRPVSDDGKLYEISEVNRDNLAQGIEGILSWCAAI